ncbi:hypothetical protein JCM10207_000050 [Rhodosporidiobolus poonsookiae]
MYGWSPSPPPAGSSSSAVQPYPPSAESRQSGFASHSSRLDFNPDAANGRLDGGMQGQGRMYIDRVAPAHYTQPPSGPRWEQHGSYEASKPPPSYAPRNLPPPAPLPQTTSTRRLFHYLLPLPFRKVRDVLDDAEHDNLRRIIHDASLVEMTSYETAWRTATVSLVAESVTNLRTALDLIAQIVYVEQGQRWNSFERQHLDNPRWIEFADKQCHEVFRPSPPQGTQRAAAPPIAFVQQPPPTHARNASPPRRSRDSGVGLDDTSDMDSRPRRGRKRDYSPSRSHSRSRSRSRSPVRGEQRRTRRQSPTPELRTQATDAPMRVDEPEPAASSLSCKISLPASAAPRFLAGSATTAFIEELTSCSLALTSTREGTTLALEAPSRRAMDEAVRLVESVVDKVEEGWKAQVVLEKKEGSDSSASDYPPSSRRRRSSRSPSPRRSTTNSGRYFDQQLPKKDMRWASVRAQDDRWARGRTGRERSRSPPPRRRSSYSHEGRAWDGGGKGRYEGGRGWEEKLDEGRRDDPPRPRSRSRSRWRAPLPPPRARSPSPSRSTSFASDRMRSASPYSRRAREDTSRPRSRRRSSSRSPSPVRSLSPVSPPEPDQSDSTPISPDDPKSSTIARGATAKWVSAFARTEGYEKPPVEQRWRDEVEREKRWEAEGGGDVRMAEAEAAGDVKRAGGGMEKDGLWGESPVEVFVLPKDVPSAPSNTAFPASASTSVSLNSVEQGDDDEMKTLSSYTLELPFPRAGLAILGENHSTLAWIEQSAGLIQLTVYPPRHQRDPGTVVLVGAQPAIIEGLQLIERALYHNLRGKWTGAEWRELCQSNRQWLVFDKRNCVDLEGVREHAQEPPRPALFQPSSNGRPPVPVRPFAPPKPVDRPAPPRTKSTPPGPARTPPRSPTRSPSPPCEPSLPRFSYTVTLPFRGLAPLLSGVANEKLRRIRDACRLERLFITHDERRIASLVLVGSKDAIYLALDDVEQAVYKRRSEYDDWEWGRLRDHGWIQFERWKCLQPLEEPPPPQGPVRGEASQRFSEATRRPLATLIPFPPRPALTLSLSRSPFSPPRRAISPFEDPVAESSRSTIDPRDMSPRRWAHGSRSGRTSEEEERALREAAMGSRRRRAAGERKEGEAASGSKEEEESGTPPFPAYPAPAPPPPASAAMSASTSPLAPADGRITYPLPPRGPKAMLDSIDEYFRGSSRSGGSGGGSDGAGKPRWKAAFSSSKG